MSNKRVFELAKELGVKSKAIVEKCQDEGVPGITNHMSTVKTGLEMTICEWFADSENGHDADAQSSIDPAKAAWVRKVASLRPVSDDDDNQINIVVHGYQAFSTPGRMKHRLREVRELGLPGRVYLLNWHANDTNALTTTSTQWATRIGWTIWRGTRLARLFSPYILIDLTLSITNLVYDFYDCQRTAKHLGRGLQVLLDDLDEPASSPINLVGHSLGARVVVEAVQSIDAEKYELDDAVLLGGAVGHDDVSWSELDKRLRGRIHNIHSKKDRVFYLIPRLNRMAGRHPIPDSAVRNYDGGQVGHFEYFTKMKSVLSEWWPGQYKTS